MFKWVWLIILGMIWFVCLCFSIKDVFITIKWCIKNKEINCLDRFEDGTWVFVIATIAVLFFQVWFIGYGVYKLWHQKNSTRVRKNG